jgi:hypothetical protein
MSAAKKSSGSSIFSPGLNAGNPRYGQPAHRNASPSEQLPHDEPSPARSSISTVSFGFSALTPAASISARPHEQLAHAVFLVEQPPSELTAGLNDISVSVSSSSSSISVTLLGSASAFQALFVFFFSGIDAPVDHDGLLATATTASASAPAPTAVTRAFKKPANVSAVALIDDPFSTSKVPSFLSAFSAILTTVPIYGVNTHGNTENSRDKSRLSRKQILRARDHNIKR